MPDFDYVLFDLGGVLIRVGGVRAMGDLAGWDTTKMKRSRSRAHVLSAGSLDADAMAPPPGQLLRIPSIESRSRASAAYAVRGTEPRRNSDALDRL